MATARTSTAGAQTAVPEAEPETNCFPFGCAVTGAAGTRYQQVYAAATFEGKLSFNTISFFTDPAYRNQLNVGAFTLYLSTTQAAVDGLSVASYDANLGATVVRFGTFVIGGAAPAVLSFVGTTYTYDPAAGSLLLDLRVNGTLIGSTDATGFVAHNGSAQGAYSRATNFGDGTAGFGLETQFSTTPTAVPEPAVGALVGGGVLGLGLLGVGGIARRRPRDRG